MNVLKSMFGVCSSSGEKVEVHETIKRIFGNEMVMKDNTDRHNQRMKYLGHVKENLPRVLDVKLSTAKGKSFKKHPVPPELSEMNDERRGRIGPRIVVFDATTATGRLVLVGDERVSVEALSNFATIRATACVYGGRWMYEVQLGTKGIMQIGWCTNSCAFSVDTGVGDTARSYSYDGARVRRWNVATSQYGQHWREGDVIGSCLDLDKGTMEFYRNGVSLGVAFSDVSRGPGLAYFPAASLASQEHLYANFGHVPFVFPVEGYQPLQAPPRRECARAAHLFGYLDVLLDEIARLSDLRAPVSGKRSKAETSKVAEEEVDLRVHSAQSVYNRPSPHDLSESSDLKGMSKKAFLMSLSRLVVIELARTLRPSYVVIAELLPRLRASLGMRTRKQAPEPQAAEFYAKMKSRNFIGLASKLMVDPQPRFCLMMDLLWTFLDEATLCDILEHCVVREGLLYDIVPQNMQFSDQIECLYLVCGLLQHRGTRHHLVRQVLFNKIW
ncbi:E3 ubiquitin-protein ligase RNF123 [Eumeta japonica]|uniref:E3 ubiquitin-protein ligase RNF123 n=1 Tax=Eumeta variegata TaxID=151549 RepID=A0A4C1VCV0_EUMVA|nr:E3 ubiquitin-protein ligase RNF123 [Eumeta japonica]